MKYVDAIAVLELTKNLALDIKSISQMEEDLRWKIAQLSETFLDDSYTEIYEYSDQIRRRIGESMGAVQVVTDQLREYYDLLSKAKEFNQTDAYDWSQVTSSGMNQTTPPITSNIINQNSMVPNLQTPRSLSVSQYGMEEESDGSRVFDSPMELSKYLYCTQGKAYSNFQGTCGLCSCANILRMAGVNYSEKDMIDYACSVNNPRLFLNKLCMIKKNDAAASGGTNAFHRKKILEHFGIKSSVIPVTMKNEMATDGTLEDIADFVKQGKGVIISVDPFGLDRNRYRGPGGRHAVTVTSVKCNKDGSIAGFYICDSNFGTSFYSAVQIQNALLSGWMNVTNSIIR